MLNDFLFSLRALRRRPGLSIVAVLTLALGTGASVAVFSVLDGVVLKPLAYPEPEHLVTIWRTDPPITRGPVSKTDFEFISGQLQDALIISGQEHVTLAVGDESGARRISGQRVTDDFFRVLGLQPLLGRWLDAGDQSGATNGVVISHGFWQEHFGRSKNAVGAGLVLSGQRWTVAGIAPPTLDYPAGTDVWVPMRLALLNTERGYNFIYMSGRMQPGVGSALVQARLNAAAAHLEEAFPQNHVNLSLNAISMQESLVSGVRDLLWTLMFAVALVTLVVCANVGNLLMGRVLAREQEFATRTALGAKPSHLARQAMLEAMVLGVVGTIAGTLLAAAAVKVLVSLQPPGLPHLDAVRLDLRVFVFAAGAALFTGLVCGLLPALRAIRTRAATIINATSGSTHGRFWTGRSVLVAGEIALSMALLVAAGLLFATMQRISDVDPGFETRNLLTAMIALPEPFPRELTSDNVVAQMRVNVPFLTALESRLQSLPGVVDAGFIDAMPLSGISNFSGGVSAPGMAFEPGTEPTVEYRAVSPGYFDAIGVPILAGTVYERRETLSWPPGGIIVINEALAAMLWPGKPADAIGREIQVSAVSGNFTVAGVVGNAKQWSLNREASPEVYLPYYGAPAPTTATIVLRTNVPPLTLVEPLRRQVAALDGQVPVFNVRSMEQVVAAGNARRAFALTLLEVFAGMAAALAAVGLYGVMAYWVVQRTHEIGVRIALGAARSRVLRTFLGDAMTIIIAGISVGVAAAFAFAGVLQGLVWADEIRTGTIYLAAGALLATVALCATLLPAWRASRIAPMQALRHE